MFSTNILRLTYTVNINLNETRFNARNAQDQINCPNKYVTTTYLPHLGSKQTLKNNMISKLIDHSVFNSVKTSSYSMVNSSSSSSFANSLSSSSSESNNEFSQNRFVYTKPSDIGQKSSNRSSLDLNFNHSVSKSIASQSNSVIYSIEQFKDENLGRKYELSGERFISISNMNLLNNRVVEEKYKSNNTLSNASFAKKKFSNQISFQPRIYLNNFFEG